MAIKNIFFSLSNIHFISEVLRTHIFSCSLLDNYQSAPYEAIQFPPIQVFFGNEQLVLQKVKGVIININIEKFNTSTKTKFL